MYIFYYFTTLKIFFDNRQFVWSLKVLRENFMAIFTIYSVVIRFSTGTLEIFATLVYFFHYAYGNIGHTEYGNNSHTIGSRTDL